jgi:predicted lipoprotein with Yx(FWY)xxD motif
MSSTTALTPTARATRPQARRHQLIPLAVGGVVAALALTACGGTSATSSGSAPSSSTATSVAATGALLAAASTPQGTILVDGQGKSVYLFAADTPGHSTCEGTCLQYWPIVPAPATLPATLTGVTATLGSLTRADGTKQLTVDGWPVYTYKGDSAAGMTSGQGKNLSGGLWWILSSSGTAIKTVAGASSSPSASTSTSTSSGGGGWS